MSVLIKTSTPPQSSGPWLSRPLYSAVSPSPPPLLPQIYQTLLSSTLIKTLIISCLNNWETLLKGFSVPTPAPEWSLEHVNQIKPVSPFRALLLHLKTQIVTAISTMLWLLLISDPIVNISRHPADFCRLNLASPTPTLSAHFKISFLEHNTKKSRLSSLCLQRMASYKRTQSLSTLVT
jgi:hypothetical protein